MASYPPEYSVLPFQSVTSISASPPNKYWGRGGERGREGGARGERKGGERERGGEGERGRERERRLINACNTNNDSLLTLFHQTL